MTRMEALIMKWIILHNNLISPEIHYMNPVTIFTAVATYTTN